MKTTISIPDGMYRQVKAKSALQGRSIREVVIELFAGWLGDATPREDVGQGHATAVREDKPEWFGSLNAYAANAGSRFDMESVRRSIALGRQGEEVSR